MKPTSILIAVLVLIGLAAVLLIFGDGLLSRGPGGLQGAVVILLDTVRADRLSCYGHGRATSPVMDGLAREGMLFEQAICYSPWTLPSVVNMLAGRRPDLRVFEGKLKSSLVEDIAAAGYRTAAVTEGGYVSEFFGMDRGFDDYHEEEGPVQRMSEDKDWSAEYTGGIEETFRRSREWITEHADERFFLFIHTYEAHMPYTRRTFTEGLDPGRVGETFTMDKIEELQSGKLAFDDGELEYLNALYDGGVLECDRQVGAFLDTLEELGLRDRTLVVVTSDHGEELGEHYPSYSGDHGHCLLDTLVRVPLIIHDPRGGCAAGSRIPHQVRLMDVMPTVADILGASVDGEVEGTSLLPLMRGEAESGRPAYGGQTNAGPDRVFLRYLGYKYILVQGPAAGTYALTPPPPDLQLFDLRADPEERANIGARELSVASKMRTILTRIKGSAGGEFAMPDPDSMDAELRERLESLGYTR